MCIIIPDRVLSGTPYSAPLDER